MNVIEHGRGKPPLDPHLKALENEAIHIFREVAAEFERPVMLYSVGKDSSVLLHLALKAFHPGKLPFPTSAAMMQPLAERGATRKPRAPRSGSTRSAHPIMPGTRATSGPNSGRSTTA